MLKSLNLVNFTVFPEADIEFSPQLNVIVGENGTGKTHLLKAPYAILASSAEEGRKPNSIAPSKAALQSGLSTKLMGVFRPESLGRLIRRRPGRARCEVLCRFHEPDLDVDFSLATNRKEITVEKPPIAWVDKPPVYLPTRELLTIYPGFLSFYESHYLELEETWRDTCLLLGAPALRGAREAVVKKLLSPLEAAIKGKVTLDKLGRFYLETEAGSLEMPLVAEGWRKFAMVARLIATGSLLDKGCLFWDEPEANLNPKLIKEIARSILHLCQNGIQIFIATHSLFLLRELDILMQGPDFKGTKARFIGLQHSDGGVEVEQGETIDDLSAITALDEELRQSDRYIEAGT